MTKRVSRLVSQIADFLASEPRHINELEDSPTADKVISVILWAQVCIVIVLGIILITVRYG